MSGAMLDCVVCNTRKWKTLEAAKAGEARSAGATKFFCSDCGRETYWLFPQNDSGAAPQRKEPELVSRMVSGTRAAVGGMSPTNGGTAAARDEIQRLSRTERRMGADRRARMRRSHRRVSLQLPVRLRVSSNGAQFEEVTRTVNVCRNGIYIQTEQPYSKGLPAYVALNYSPREPYPLTEQKGTVVRVDSLPGNSARGVAIQLH